MADDKRRLFIESYLRHFNATRAALEAGYSAKSAYSQAGRLLKTPEIRAAIESRITDAAMSANEVLSRLSEMARADIGDYLERDITQLRRHPRSHLLKRVKRTIKTRALGDGATETTEVIEIELHDPQAALVQLGRYYGLFVDRVKSEDWHSQAIDDIRARRVTFDDLAEAFDYDKAAELFRAAGEPVPPRPSTDESGAAADGSGIDAAE